MEYNSCCVRFPKTIQSKYQSASLCINELYNSSSLGNSCPLFDELDRISNEMDNGNRVKLNL